jgi:hemoglobin
MFVPPIHPSQIPGPSREIYDLMGEDNILRMIRDFYAELAKSEIRWMFPPNEVGMAHAAEKSAAFFIGLLGGPPIYHQRYGNPAMRARHMPFPIDQDRRDEWLACFERVLVNAEQKYNFPAQHLDQFRAFLRGFSIWMMNTEKKA